MFAIVHGDNNTKKSTNLRHNDSAPKYTIISTDSLPSTNGMAATGRILETAQSFAANDGTEQTVWFWYRRVLLAEA
jgi:hypothetical protein